MDAPCSATDRCRNRGYHFIPAAYHEALGEGLPDPQIGQRFGDYLVVDRIGQGGMGSVYLALLPAVGMKAALKVLNKPHLELERRFLGEARALARLYDPHIVRLLHFGIQPRSNAPFLVMEYVDQGRTLAAQLKEGVDLASARHILRGAAQGLEAAHALPLVHRDIKPENIMLQRLRNDPYFVRLVDFGLAKEVAEGDATQMLAGTAAYMAPEQIRQMGIGPWTDWYALGGVALRLLTGQRPFPEMSRERIVMLKASADYDPVAVAEGRLAPEALAFLRRAMAYDPQQRTRTAAEFLEAMEPAFDALMGRPSVRIEGAPEGATTMARAQTASMGTSLPVVDSQAADGQSSGLARGEISADPPPVANPPLPRSSRWRFALPTLVAAVVGALFLMSGNPLDSTLEGIHRSVAAGSQVPSGRPPAGAVSEGPAGALLPSGESRRRWEAPASAPVSVAVATAPTVQPESRPSVPDKLPPDEPSGPDVAGPVSAPTEAPPSRSPQILALRAALRTLERHRKKCECDDYNAEKTRIEGMPGGRAALAGSKSCRAFSESLGETCQPL